ncbi:GNAT family N-acetyltransferase [Leucobacter japonicus]|uniref:GNAT family N-acetyltransferase n=1 Tax=Leucobacter japonicus TaxID=1461259 RepID=UPI0006A7E91F|nr:GNAT family N-acetyltransferase [Leucobacter japonicus]
MELQNPSASYFSSFQHSLVEWGAAHQDGAGIRDAGDLTSIAGFTSWVDELRAEEMAPAGPGLVTCSYFWMVEDGEYLGSIALRHELNDYLAEFGGHIGYSVRPSRRGRGLAAEALARALPLVAARGIPQVLLVCAADNLASRRTIERTIERSGGAFDGEVRDGLETLRRYWIDTDSIV